MSITRKVGHDMFAFVLIQRNVYYICRYVFVNRYIVYMVLINVCY